MNLLIEHYENLTNRSLLENQRKAELRKAGIQPEKVNAVMTTASLNVNRAMREDAETESAESLDPKKAVATSSKLLQLPPKQEKA